MSRNRILHLGIGLVLALFLWTVSGVSPAAAQTEATCTSTGTGNWGTTGTWTGCGGLVPQDNDTVVIAAGHTITVNTNTNDLASLTVNGTLTLGNSGTTRNVNVLGTVTINSGGTINLNNAVGTNTQNLNMGGNFVNDGTFTTINGDTIVVTFNGSSAQTVSGANAPVFANVTINTGATVNLNQNCSVLTGRTMTVNGTLNTGSFTISGAGTFSLASGGTLGIGSTVGITTAGATGNIQTTTRTYSLGGNYLYNGAASQNTGTGFPTNLAGDLIINNPGNTVTLSAARTIANGGLVNLTAGTLAAGTNLTMASTSTMNRSEGSMTGTPQGGGTYDVNYTGNSKTTGTELAGSGLRTVTVNLTAGQTLTLDANRAPDGNLTITAGTFDLSTFTINRSGAGGILTLSNGATLKIGGTNSFPSNYTSNHIIGPTSTVEYSGTTQNVAGVTGNYGHLIISGSGTKTLAGNENVVGNLTINGGTFDLTTFTIHRAAAGGTLTVADGASLKIGGTNTIPFNYSAHAIGATSTIEFAGTAQSIPALNSSQSYGHLTTSGSGNKTLAAAISVRGNWTNNGGTIVPGAGTVTFNGTTTQTISGNVTPFNNLTINANAIVIIPPTNIPTVAGTMTNNGTVQQTQAVNNAAVQFLTLSSDKYRGVDITTVNNLGNVTVAIRGNSGLTCPNVVGASPVYVFRCFDITVETQGAATLTFWATGGELNGILPGSLSAYRFSSSWNELTNITAGTGSNNYYSVQGDTPGFSNFLMGDTNFSPTAITLSQVGVVSGMSALWVVLVGLLLLVSAGWWVRGKVNSKQ